MTTTDDTKQHSLPDTAPPEAYPPDTGPPEAYPPEQPATSSADAVAKLRQENASLKRQIAALRTAKNELTAAKKQLGVRVTELEKALGAAEETNHALTAENDNLRTALHAGATELAKLAWELATTRQELGAVAEEEQREEARGNALEAEKAELVAHEAVEDKLQQILNIADAAERIRAVNALTAEEFEQYTEMRQSS